jgi:hypothetical protein
MGIQHGCRCTHAAQEQVQHRAGQVTAQRSPAQKQPLSLVRPPLESLSLPLPLTQLTCCASPGSPYPYPYPYP